jgi:hypothetical protein
MRQQWPWEQGQDMPLLQQSMNKAREQGQGSMTPSKPMMPLPQDSMKSKRGTCLCSQL